MSARRPYTVELEVAARVLVEVNAANSTEAMEEAIAKRSDFRRVIQVVPCTEEEFLASESESAE